MSDLFSSQASAVPAFPSTRITGGFNPDSELAATQLLATPTHDFHYLGTTIRPLRGLLATSSSETSNTPDLYDLIANVETLRRAWQTLHSRQKPRQSIVHEALSIPEPSLQNLPPKPAPTQIPAPEDIDAQLHALSEQLHAGTYRPSQLIGFRLPQRKGHKARDLRVPIMRDRVVERAIVDVITPSWSLCIHRVPLAFVQAWELTMLSNTLRCCAIGGLGMCYAQIFIASSPAFGWTRFSNICQPLSHAIAPSF